MELDPNYPRAYTGMSLSYFNEWSCQLWSRWEVSRNGAFEWAQKALELDEWDNVSNAIIGRIYLFNGEYEKAEHFLRKSLRINPNDAETLVLIAFGLTYLGYAKEAIELYMRAKRLNPADNFLSNACGAFVHFEMGEADEAISLAEQYEIGKGWVDFAAYQAAAYFMKGDMEKMQEKWLLFLKEFSEKINGGKPANTQTALQWMINVNPYRHETHLRPFWEHIGQTEPEKLLVAKQDTAALLSNSFSKEGGLWTMAYDGKQVQLPDLKGFADLASLLGQPGKEIHCTELMGAVAIEKGTEVFDETAKTAYQNRILELQEEIAEAETAFDHQRLATLHAEYDQLLEHISRSLGKGGKARKVSDSVEKCRTAVTWRIRSAMKKIAEAHPALGKHLENAIRTGVFCQYAPEFETNWLV
jgi:tetratricopeptide (TPR) repeat protein